MKLVNVSNPNIPYAELLHDKFKEGTRIRIKAKIEDTSTNNFNIHLQKTSEGVDRMLLISVRPQEIIRNTAVKNIWGEEEKFGGMPIRLGIAFELLIIANEKSFEIMIDGVHFADYVYRSLIENIDFIKVEGDGTIYSITEEYDFPNTDSSFNFEKLNKSVKHIERNKTFDALDLQDIDIPIHLINSRSNKNLYFIFN